jgi:hypothetical protein
LSTPICEADTDFVRAVRVRHDLHPARVRLVDDRLRNRERHLVLIDQLDDVHARLVELTAHAPWHSATEVTAQR